MAESARTTESQKERSQEKLWTPLFLFIIIMTLCSFMVGQGLNSGTSVYLDHLGQGATLAGILAAVFSAAAGITRIACGPLIDSAGRVIVMLGGTIFMFVGTVLPVFISDITVFSFCRILQGIGFSAATTAAATAASDVLPLSRLGEGVGYYGLGQALAMSMGPALALFLVNTNPPENLYLGLSAMAALALVFTLFCRYEKNLKRLPETSTYRLRMEAKRAKAEKTEAKQVEAGRTKKEAENQVKSCTDSVDDQPGLMHGKQAESDREETRQVRETSDVSRAENEPNECTRRKESFLHRFFELRALPGMLPMLVLSPAFGFGIFFMGLYGTSLGYANAGLFYTISAVAMIVVRLASRAFMDRVAPIKIMTGAGLCGIVGFVMTYFGAHNEALFYAAGVPYGLCLGIANPLNQAVAVKNTPPERWGAANALFLLANDIGIGVASAVWGVVNDLAGFSTTIMCVLICIVASLVVAWFAYPNHGLTRQMPKE